MGVTTEAPCTLFGASQPATHRPGQACTATTEILPSALYGVPEVWSTCAQSAGKNDMQAYNSGTFETEAVSHEGCQSVCPLTPLSFADGFRLCIMTLRMHHLLDPKLLQACLKDSSVKLGRFQKTSATETVQSSPEPCACRCSGCSRFTELA